MGISYIGCVVTPIYHVEPAWINKRFILILSKIDRTFYPKSEIEFLISLRIVIYKIVIS